MSKKIASSSSSSSSSASSKKENAVMSKKIASSSSSSTSNKKDLTTMSKKIASSSSSSSSSSDAIVARILELLGKNADGEAVSEASEASEASASKKADRAYEFPALNGSFSKELFARPLTPEAGKVHAACDGIRKIVLRRCKAPIAQALDSVKSFDDVKALLNDWIIPARALRTVLQLVSPIVCVSCDDTRTLAHMYDMDKANSLMGSVCNSFMYEKIVDKSQAIPFKRVCYNFTTLGLSIGQEWDGDEVGECVRLCNMWLSQCTPKSAPKKAEKSAPKRGSFKAEKSSEKDKPVIDKNAIMAMIEQLLNN